MQSIFSLNLFYIMGAKLLTYDVGGLEQEAYYKEGMRDGR